MSGDDLTRLCQELAAASSRAEAETVFAGADWIFACMTPEERRLAYERISDIIAEKPR